MVKVSILIPTMNRPEFVVRLLEYYNLVKSKHPIYIGDASNSINKNKLLEKINAYKSVLDVNYFHWPNFNDLETLDELVKQSKEDYCAYIGDDDFLIPNSLEICANFLEKNLDYRTAQGKAMIFHFKETGPYGKTFFSGEYWKNNSIENDKSSERFLEFGKNYWTPVFSVKRRNEFLKDLEFYGNMPDKNFGELISNFTFISRGKSKFLDCLYLIRQGHNERYLMKSGTNWVKSPNWNRSLQICIKSLSSIISKEDQISYKKANYIVNKVFDDIIVRSIKKDDKISENLFNKAKNLFKNHVLFSDLLISLYRNLQAFLFPKKFEMSHLRILKKNSKYYKDFKPIYKVITNKF